MREKKKMPLKIVFFGILTLLVIGGSVYCISHHSLFKDKPKEETKKTIEVDKTKEKDNKNKEQEEEQKVEEKGEESSNKNNETKVDSTPKTNNNSSSNQSSNNASKNNVTSNKNTNIQNNNKTENIPKQEPPVPETPKQEEPQPVAPSCTPKKFDMNFVRADFSSFGACTQMGDKYKEAGYGYFCDNYQDDCGTTYYMLTIYERNTGKEYDYHTIQLP